MYKGAIQEKRFEYKGFPCVVVMQAMGFRTGYVGIPKGHKLFGTDYNDIYIDCHGGLTYADNYLVDQEDEDVWWIGYDCGHYGDGHDVDTCKELFKDYPETIKQITLMQDIDIYGILCDEKARSLEYCEEQCKNIVEQIINKTYEREE